MSIFEELHSATQFGGWQDYEELLRLLNEAIEQGHVMEITPGTEQRHAWSERWFVEKKSGIVFRLLEPDPPAAGWWAEVEFPDTPVQ